MKLSTYLFSPAIHWALFCSVSLFPLSGNGASQNEEYIPDVVQVEKVPDFSAFRGNRKKKAFFDFLRPIVHAENAKVAMARGKMLGLSAQVGRGETLSPADRQWLFDLADNYHIEFSIENGYAWEQLKRRVDTVPFRLALAQAANETNWGTSRFARQGRNFFGEWCLTSGCGIVPMRRPKGQTHEVAVFKTVNESVASYLRNLNRSNLYLPLRVARLEIRKNGEDPTAHTLAAGLTGYSARGEAYVKDIRKLIRANYSLMGE